MGGVVVTGITRTKRRTDSLVGETGTMETKTVGFLAVASELADLVRRRIVRIVDIAYFTIIIHVVYIAIIGYIVVIVVMVDSFYMVYIVYIVNIVYIAYNVVVVAFAI